MSEALDVTNLEPGTVLLDKYRVVETLGAGGMGVVIACEHLSLGNKVAIKFMLPELVTNEPVVRRFVQEARAAIKINSEHVARVLDVGSLEGEGLPAKGLPYMVMEYLEGRDLSEWLALGKRFEITEAIDLTVQAAEALAQAHKVGIVHRDVKPANLFVTEHDGNKRVKVLDFGISKLMGEQPEQMGLTKTTTVLGSGLYMSPEQMRSARNIDHRTDVYSLGVCLYELLAGVTPYTAETFSELCVKVNVDPPTPLLRHRPDGSRKLAKAIAFAYARSPDDRYQSLQQFARALEPFADEATLPIIDRVAAIDPPLSAHGGGKPPPGTREEDELPAATAPGSLLGSPLVYAAALLLAAGVVGLSWLRAPKPSVAPAASTTAAAHTAAGPSAAPPSRSEKQPDTTAPPLAASRSAAITASAAASTSASAAASGSATPPGSARPRASAAPANSTAERYCLRIDPERNVLASMPCD